MKGRSFTNELKQFAGRSQHEAVHTLLYNQVLTGTHTTLVTAIATWNGNGETAQPYRYMYML